MKPAFINIINAMQFDRPTDKVIAVLNNKYCLAYSMYENGSFDKTLTVFGLDNGKVYSWGSPSSLKNYIETVENRAAKTFWSCYVGNTNKIKLVCCKASKWKRGYRKAFKAIKQYEQINCISL